MLIKEIYNGIIKKQLSLFIQVFESQPGYSHFQIEGADVDVADVFECMEMAKEQYEIEDYIVHRVGYI